MQHPEVTLLDKDDLKGLEDYLQQRSWIEDGETVVRAAPAGEGNMNTTLRIWVSKSVRSDPSDRTFILKQSYPWVAKYDQIAAPWDRILQEAQFYQMVHQNPAVGSKMPKLLELDSVARVVLFEDLGAVEDLSSLYTGRELKSLELKRLTDWLCQLHSLPFNDAEKQRLANHDMRTLNHEHIFLLPLRSDNGLDLNAITPGLKSLALQLQRESCFVKTVEALGHQYYLSDGPVLLHGDYFPGSWLGTGEGMRIIDPEFAFFGHAEFDAGVLLAHLILAEQPTFLIRQFLKDYKISVPFSMNGIVQIAGVEIMRRILGVAQLPIKADLTQKQKLLTIARQFVLNPNETTFS